MFSLAAYLQKAQHPHQGTLREQSIAVWPDQPFATGRDGRRKRASLLVMAIGYGLILANIWTEKALQRELFFIAVAYFIVVAAIASRNKGLRLPRIKLSLLLVSLGMLVAGLLLLTGAALGTLHGLFGKPKPLLHASGYLLWTVIQQYLQQEFFFVRIERFTRHGITASLIAATLFGLAHLPNPVLTPVTLIGGFLLSELFRRYRTFVPLGIAQGLVGLALAVTVPDQAMHHMRVGLGYLHYHG